MLCHCLYIQTQISTGKKFKSHCIYNQTFNLKRGLYENITVSRVHYGHDCHLGTDKRQGVVASDLTLRSSQNIKHQHLHHCPCKVQSCCWLICHLKHRPLPVLWSSHQLATADQQKGVFSPFLMTGCEFMQTHSFPMITWVKKKAEWWSYYCLGTSFSCQ